MLKRPGSENPIKWFYYKIIRKIRFLRTRGTLFHKAPREDRLSSRRAFHLKISRRRRRKFRHVFLYLRPKTLRRFNRVLNYGIPRINNDTIESRGKPGKKMRVVYRRLRYLYNTGGLFKFNFRSTLVLINRNFSFLGNRKYLVILLNSTFLFLLAYLFVFLLRELAIVIAAGSFDIKVVMMYYDVEFLIRSRDWTSEAVKVVFSTGPMISFLLTLIALAIFSLVSYETWFIRLFFIWVLLHAVTQSFGELVLGALFNQGFGWVLAYLYFDDTEKMVIVVAILLAMVAAGMILSRYLLLTGNIYFNTLSKSNRISFFRAQFLFPFLIGTGILILLKQPLKNSFELFVECLMLLVLLPANLWASFSLDLFFDEEPRKARIRWVWIAAALLAIVIFRIFFWTGVRLF